MRMPPSRARSGFTLIELMVVLGIMLVLATLALFITPRFAEDQRVSRGADQLQGWLLISKQRAYRDQVPRGIRLVPRGLGNSTGDNQFWVKELVFIERPDPIRGTRLQVPAIPAQFNTAFVPIVNWQIDDIILPGDFLQLNLYERAPYNVHRISNVLFTTLPVDGVPTQGTLLTLAAADGTPSNISGPIPGGPDTTVPDLFNIIRQPRPMLGEQPLQMPRDVVIDLDPATEGTSILPGGSMDILFSERGQVMGLNAVGGKIVLRVRPSDRPAAGFSTATNMVYDSGEQILITIYTRTGTIAAQPVHLELNANPNPPVVPFLADPYRFIRDGLSSGL